MKKLKIAWVTLAGAGMIFVLFVVLRFATLTDDQINREASQAASSGNLLKLRVLQRMGADLHKTVPGRGPFIISAAWNGKDHIISYLLTEGVDIETKDKFGGTALSRAAQAGHISTVKMLIKTGANANVQDCEGGNTTIDLCRMNCVRIGFNPQPIIELLVQSGGTAQTTEIER